MGLKSANAGLFTIPTAPAAGTSITSGAANVYSASYVQLIASTAAAIFVTGIQVALSSTSKPTYLNVQLATGGAGSETVVGQVQMGDWTTSGATGTVISAILQFWPPIPVANATRIAAKVADSVGSLAWLISLQGINQANVVDAGINESSDLQTIKTQAITCSAGVTVGAFVGNATAALGVDASGRVDLGKALGQVVTLDANNALNVSTKYVGGTLQTAGDIYSKVSGLTFTVSNQVDVNAKSWAGGTIPATNVTGVPLVDAKYLLGTIFVTPATAGVMDVNLKNVNNVAYGLSTLNTLASHDPGATIGTSTLTQTQVTGGAYSVQSVSCVLGDARVANLDAAVSSRSTLTQTQVTGGAYALSSASFSFNAALDFTTTQKTSLNAATPVVAGMDPGGVDGFIDEMNSYLPWTAATDVNGNGLLRVAASGFTNTQLLQLGVLPGNPQIQTVNSQTDLTLSSWAPQGSGPDTNDTVAGCTALFINTTFGTDYGKPAFAKIAGYDHVAKRLTLTAAPVGHTITTTDQVFVYMPELRAAAPGDQMGLSDGAITDAKFTVPALSGPATGTVGRITQLWRRFFKKAVLDTGAGKLRTYADDGTTVATTQDATTSGGIETQEAAT